MNKIIAKYVFVILLALTVFGGLLRFYKISENPISLSIDEVSFGYNAYSILKTGRDEYGKFLPLTFESTGDYKNPVPIYSMVPSIALFGLSEFGIRFPTALIATLTIPFFFLLFMEITDSLLISLAATVLLTISPWHIYYSRYVSDHLMAASLVILGVLCFLRMLKTGRWFWSVGSAIFFVLSMYTYYAERLFIPLLVLALFLLKRRDLNERLKQIILFIIVCVIIASPLVFSIFFGPDRARAQMTWIGNDVEFVRNVAVKPLSSISFLDSDNLLLFYFGARKYLYYFDPGFLFYSGLNMTKGGSYGLGVLYLFEIPFLILGIIALFKAKIANRGLMIAWILIGLIPASLTNNEQHPGRTFIILPMLILISAIGAIEFFKLINFRGLKVRGFLLQVYKSSRKPLLSIPPTIPRKTVIAAFIPVLRKRGFLQAIIKTHFNQYLQNIIFASFFSLILWNLIQAFLIFSVHFPRQRGENFMEGTKETVEYALANKNKYKELVFDPYRGIEAPYIVSIPHMYILFYSKYDPATYQQENKIRSDGSFGFDNFTIRKIDWRIDRYKKDTLFIGSPWSLPEKDIKNGEILKKVYLSGGQLAFLIVSPK